MPTLDVLRGLAVDSDTTGGWTSPQLSPRRRSQRDEALVEGAATPTALGRLCSKQSVESYVVRARSALVVEDEFLLRGMPVQLGLKGFASVLSARPATAEYFEMSHPVKSIGTFISHNWNTHRFLKWVALCFHYNLKQALVLAYLVAAVACALTVLGVFPTARTELRIDEAQEGYVYLHGFVSLPAGLVAFVACLLFIHELDRFCLTRSRDIVFLDKTCVHQLNEEQKQRGIRCLAAFLACSKDMLILYSDIYLQRLWTSYEVASWLMLHKGEKMTVRPVFVPIYILIGFLSFGLLEMLLFAVRLIDTSERFLYFPALLFGLTLGWILAAMLMAKIMTLRDRMEDHASKFTLREAKCASEEDKAAVQQNIIDFTRYARGNDGLVSDAEVLEAFEKLVQREVPQLMRHSFGRMGTFPYDFVLVGGLPHTLVTFDYFAGNVVENNSLRAAAMQAVMHLVFSLTVAPLLVAAMAKTMRQGRCRSGGSCVCLGFSMTFLLGIVLMVLDVLREWATHSDIWLAVLLIVSVLLSAATAMAYRPLPRQLGQKIV